MVHCYKEGFKWRSGFYRLFDPGNYHCVPRASVLLGGVIKATRGDCILVRRCVWIGVEYLMLADGIGYKLAGLLAKRLSSYRLFGWWCISLESYGFSLDDDTIYFVGMHYVLMVRILCLQLGSFGWWCISVLSFSVLLGLVMHFNLFGCIWMVMYFCIAIRIFFGWLYILFCRRHLKFWCWGFLNINVSLVQVFGWWCIYRVSFFLCG